ncbi:MAG: CHAT domain-containing protein [Bryobacterales bacterium]|nr:CHAT domain-containing protein [Bryobacterales bacterium]
MLANWGWVQLVVLLASAQQTDADAEYKRAYGLLQQMRPAEAIEPFRRSAEMNEKAGNLMRASIAWNNLGAAYSFLGEVRLSIEAYEKALGFRVRIKDRFGEGLTVMGVASVEWRRGEYQRAIDLYNQALVLFREEKAVPQQADVLSSLGLVFADIGDEASARQRYNDALQLWRASKDKAGESRTLNNLGMLTHDAAALQQSLAIAEEMKDQRGRAYTLHNLGDAYMASGALAKADEAYRVSLGLKREIGDRAGLAATLNSQGRLRLRQKDVAGAVKLLEESVEVYRAIEDRNGEAAALADWAYALRASGALDKAAEQAEAALALTESSRAELLAPNLRMSFLSSRRDVYQLLTDIRMKQHAAAPGKGFDAMAFDANERSRARVLLDSLPRADLEALPANAALLDQQRRVRAAGAVLSQLLVSGSSEARQKEARQRLDGALFDYEQVVAKLEAQGDPDLALLRPRPLPLQQIQASLPEDAALLVYSTGQEGGYVWTVTRRRLASQALPRRSVLEPLIRAMQQSATAPTQVQDASRAARAERLAKADAAFESAAAKVRSVLIPPGLAARRVFLVPDGPLHWIPFSALLSLDRHTLTWFPSSTFAARKAEQGQNGGITVFADPVYEAALPRLAASASEAEVIRSQAGTGRVRVLLRHEATREAFLSAAKTSSILHLATHALVDDARPRVSGIAFSMFTPEAKMRDGLLRLGEIYALRMNKSLVVLSACESRAGQEYRGEGLASLAHGFLHAGARQVVASLWPVADGASAVLMEHFYREMLQNRRSPAEALRLAQMAVKKEPRFRSPFYWAGFVVEGH